VEEKRLDDLRQHTQQQRAWGSERFQQQIEALTQRSVRTKPRGRPPKPPKKWDQMNLTLCFKTSRFAAPARASTAPRQSKRL
jgi:hypothetical protein